MDKTNIPSSRVKVDDALSAATFDRCRRWFFRPAGTSPAGRYPPEPLSGVVGADPKQPGAAAGAGFPEAETRAARAKGRSRE